MRAERSAECFHCKHKAWHSVSRAHVTKPAAIVVHLLYKAGEAEKWTLEFYNLVYKVTNPPNNQGESVKGVL